MYNVFIIVICVKFFGIETRNGTKIIKQRRLT